MVGPGPEPEPEPGLGFFPSDSNVQPKLRTLFWGSCQGSRRIRFLKSV